MRRSRLGAIVLMGLAVAARPHAPVVARADAQSTDLAAWLERYERHDYAVVTDARAIDIKTFSKRISDAAPKWVSAAGANALERRRLIAATFALEVLQPAIENIFTIEDGVARDLIEWGCRLVRANSIPSQAERFWHLAAVALSERLFDEVFLTGHYAPFMPPHAVANDKARYHGNIDHLAHAEARFPDEPRFKLARVLTIEMHNGGAWFWLGRSTATALDAYEKQWIERGLAEREAAIRTVVNDQSRQLIGMYANLAAMEAVRAEAHLRAGVLEFRLEQYDAALDHLRQVESNTNEPALVYLSHFFRAKVFERTGRGADAETEYRSALLAMPFAQSSVTALSAALFLHDARDDAYGLVDATLAARPRPVDPWREYWCGDCRLLPKLIERLHEELR